MERILSPTVDIKRQVNLMQRYKKPNAEQFWRQINARLIYTPRSWPATWHQIPELNPRAQALWMTGVVECLNQKDFEKAKKNIVALLKNKIEPPGGKIAFQTWLLLIGAGKKFAALFDLPEKVEDLFKKEPEAVCATLLCHPDPVALGTAKFVCQVVEYHLNSGKDPWPIYEKLNKRHIDDALRARWISQATPSRICQLLPTHRPGTPFLEYLKKPVVIEGLASSPALHPWICELLLDGPQIDWDNDLLVRVCNRLIEEQDNPRRIELVAVYGQRLPEYNKIWECVTSHDPDKALSFTATWIQQGISLVCIKQLHLQQARKPHSSVEEFFRLCVEQDHNALALELWNKIPLFRHKKFLPLAKQLFMRVEDLDLAKWVLQNAPVEKDLFMRALTLPIDQTFAVKILCPVFLRLKLDDKEEPAINERLVPFLSIEDLTIPLLDQIFSTTNLDPSTAPKIATMCFLKADDDPEWLDICWHIIKNLKQKFDVWDEQNWNQIFNLFSKKVRLLNIEQQFFAMLEYYKKYWMVIESIFSDEFAKETLPHKQYLFLLRCYSLSEHDKDSRAHCRTLWEDALNTFPHQRWDVSFLELLKLNQDSCIESLIARMEECQWINNEYADVLRFSIITDSILSKTSCDEEGVKIVGEQCELAEKVLPILAKYIPALYEMYSIDDTGIIINPRLGSLQKIPEIVLKGTGENEIHAKQIITIFHEFLSRLVKSGIGLGEFFRDFYCLLLIKSKRVIPHWWMEEIIELFQRYPNILSYEKGDDLIIDLQMCALACGPEPDGDPLHPNNAMKRIHTLVKDCLEKGILEFDQSTEARVICVAGGCLSEISQQNGLQSRHLKGIKYAFADICTIDKPSELWRWYVNRQCQILLNCARNSIAIDLETSEILKFLYKIGALLAGTIQDVCPENEREVMLESYLHFLMSEELTPLFTPPNNVTKLPKVRKAKGTHTNYKKLVGEYEQCRVSIVYNYLYELSDFWGVGLKPLIMKWVNALVKSQFFEPKVIDIFKKKWKDGKKGK